MWDIEIIERNATCGGKAADNKAIMWWLSSAASPGFDSGISPHGLVGGRAGCIEGT